MYTRYLPLSPRIKCAIDAPAMRLGTKVLYVCSQKKLGLHPRRAETSARHNGSANCYWLESTIEDAKRAGIMTGKYIQVSCRPLAGTFDIIKYYQSWWGRESQTRISYQPLLPVPTFNTSRQISCPDVQTKARTCSWEYVA